MTDRQRSFFGDDDDGPIDRGEAQRREAQLRKLSHSDDPSTSKQAIAKLDAAGTRGAHRAMVYRYVAGRPGQTAPEIAAALELEEYQVRRRLTDLKNDALVQRGTARACQVKGTNMVTWSVTGGEAQHVETSGNNPPAVCGARAAAGRRPGGPPAAGAAGQPGH